MVDQARHEHSKCDCNGQDSRCSGSHQTWPFNDDHHRQDDKSEHRKERAQRPLPATGVLLDELIEERTPHDGDQAYRRHDCVPELWNESDPTHMWYGVHSDSRDHDHGDEYAASRP